MTKMTAPQSCKYHVCRCMRRIVKLLLTIALQALHARRPHEPPGRLQLEPE